MARGPDKQHHHMSNQCRVFSLIDAFLELILVLCIFLCAIISVTTTRLVKLSGVFFCHACVSCDVHFHHHRREGGSTRDDDLNGNRKLDYRNLPGNNGSGYRDPTPTSIISEDCSLSLSKCACTVNQRVHRDSAACRNGRCLHKLGCSADQTVWATDDYGYQNQCGWSFSSFENDVDVSNECMSFDDTTTIAADGCECKRCIKGHSPVYSRSRAVKREFSKVFSNDSSGDCCSSSRAAKREFSKVFSNDSSGDCCSSSRCNHLSHGLANSAPLFIRKEGPAEEIGESADNGLPLMHTDGSSSRFLVDGSNGDCQHRGGFFPKDSIREPSEESFVYRNGRSSGAEVFRNRLNLSIDTDLLAGDRSSEWCGSSASPTVVWEEMEMEDAGITVHEDGPQTGVMKLREAFSEEQEALAVLYQELEEERKAASSAAQEAMAMITRLQEEKAAIQTEARQYQRMVEEKQQYDQESLVMLQDILVRRDEEVYGLEEDLYLCKKRLLSLGMDELIDLEGLATYRVESSPKRGDDVLLIEQETLLLKGSEEWKSKRSRQDAKLLAKIKNWLQKANQKVAPERIEELNVIGNFHKVSGDTNRLLSDGKKNLLDSFSSVATEGQTDVVNKVFGTHGEKIANEELETRKETSAGSESFQGMMESLRHQSSLKDEGSLEMLKKFKEKFYRQSSKEDGIVNEVIEAHVDGIVNEEFQIHTESAAGYESFQEMMESCRQQPSMRDEESLKTLKKIEEKFHRQSSIKGKVRTGDELRQILKNILKNFERDEGKDAEVGGEGAAKLREQSLTSERPSASKSPNQIELESAADADRSKGEKRMSVLDYVSKFEEQFHQLGNKRRPQAGKQSSIIEAVGEVSSEFVDIDNENKMPSSSPERMVR